jgi:predicted lipoprotein with Yx(FWY)xxD motif
MHRSSTRLVGAVGAALAAIALTGAAITPAAQAGTAGAKRGTVISIYSGPYGRMLVVGSGKYKGYSLYAITSDHGHHFGCTTTVMTIAGHHGSCTGPSDDKNAEWPAITTNGKPVAGSGVSQSWLGKIYRKHVGWQVTYAGHPLYLFDNRPHQVTGQGFDEPSLPPWHGVWWVVAPSGNYQPWAETLTTMKIGKRTVLAAVMNTVAGPVDFPVYSFSKDSLTSSACNGACARAWPPLLTTGHPVKKSGVYGRYVSVIGRCDGTLQLSYDGQPLYLFANEKVVVSGKHLVAKGSGNGIRFDGGKFSFVRP